MADSPLLVAGSAKSPSKWGYSVFSVTISLAGVACVATTLGILLAPKPSATTPVASQIQLHYYNGSTTKMEVDFASTTQSTSVGVEFGTSADKLYFAAAASSVQYSVQATGYTSPYLYSAVLDLSQLGSPLPSRVYYRVVTLGADGVGTVGAAWSSLYSFPPHPGIGVPGVTVAVMGDLGTTNNSVDTMAHLFAGAKPAFSSIVLAGDLSYAGEWRGLGTPYECGALLARPAPLLSVSMGRRRAASVGLLRRRLHTLHGHGAHDDGRGKPRWGGRKQRSGVSSSS